MNDRGLNLTPTEMLKGYVLSRISDANKRIEVSDIWKKEIQKLHQYDDGADQDFFKLGLEENMQNLLDLE